MIDPVFWLGLSILLVAVSLTAVLVAALPALRELGRAARSAEKLFDTLSRELPPTLEAIRLTGMEISDLTDDVSEGVQSAGQVVKQVDKSIQGAKNQARQAQVTTRSVFAGVKAAWRTFRRPTPRRSPDRLPPSSRTPLEFEDDYPPRDSYEPYRSSYGGDRGDNETNLESADGEEEFYSQPEIEAVDPDWDSSYLVEPTEGMGKRPRDRARDE